MDRLIEGKIANNNINYKHINSCSGCWYSQSIISQECNPHEKQGKHLLVDDSFVILCSCAQSLLDGQPN